MIEIPKKIILIFLASASGIIILLGYFFDIPGISSIRSLLLNWAVILAAVALLIGLLNLVRVHLRRIVDEDENRLYSVVLILSLLITLGVGILYGIDSEQSLWIFNNIHVPIESSILALLAVVLVFSAVRLLYRKPSGFSLIFLVIVIIVLIGTVSVPWVDLSLLNAVRQWIMRVPILGGARGLLLGVTLGIIATGLRVLMAADRPYED